MHHMVPGSLGTRRHPPDLTRCKAPPFRKRQVLRPSSRKKSRTPPCRKPRAPIPRGIVHRSVRRIPTIPKTMASPSRRRQRRWIFASPDEGGSAAQTASRHSAAAKRRHIRRVIRKDNRRREGG